MNGTSHQAGHGQHEFTIIVNGREHKVTNNVLSFADVVNLAFPNHPSGDSVIFTVTYRNADSDRREGTLVEGQTVTIKNGTVFNVSSTNRS
jgi:hypothetical protein